MNNGIHSAKRIEEFLQFVFPEVNVRYDRGDPPRVLSKHVITHPRTRFPDDPYEFALSADQPEIEIAGVALGELIRVFGPEIEWEGTPP